MTLFYCAHWQTYVSGTLRFGKVDVTEAQVTIMMIQMVSAVFGSNIWTTKVMDWPGPGTGGTYEPRLTIGSKLTLVWGGDNFEGLKFTGEMKYDEMLLNRIREEGRK